MKYLSLGEAETKRQQAIEFLHSIGKDDQAEVFEAMSPEEYAEHKGAEIISNPNSGRQPLQCNTQARRRKLGM